MKPTEPVTEAGKAQHELAWSVGADTAKWPDTALARGAHSPDVSDCLACEEIRRIEDQAKALVLNDVEGLARALKDAVYALHAIHDIGQPFIRCGFCERYRALLVASGTEATSAESDAKEGGE